MSTKLSTIELVKALENLPVPERRDQVLQVRVRNRFNTLIADNGNGLKMEEYTVTLVSHRYRDRYSTWFEWDLEL
jgi:hypothetical protein